MRILNCPKCQTKLKNASGIGQFCPNRSCDIVDNIEQIKLEWKAPSESKKGIVEECATVLENLIKSSNLNSSIDSDLWYEIGIMASIKEIKKHFNIEQ